MPIYKSKNSKASALSYRSVSLCAVFNGVLEKIVRDQVIEMVDKSSAQYGFSKGHSTITNLLVTENVIAESLNKRHPVDIISLNFSKAFDKVPHDRLPLELNRRGITGEALQWLRSFLTDHTQIVRTTALLSSRPVPLGVIQSSIFSVMSFSIFIDSLLRQLGLNAGTYADDLEVMRNLEHITRIFVQSEISIVYDLSKANNMPRVN